MAGLGLSGDLREPGRAIPLGSLSAVVTGFVIYLTVPFLLAIGAVVVVELEIVLIDDGNDSA